MKTIITESLNKSLSYLEYREQVSESVNRETYLVDGMDALPYVKMNDQRMKRLDKTLMITDEVANFLKDYKQPLLWIVLTEGWCGDAAQALPVLNKMAALTETIDLKIVLRDENIELMNHFLTNGAKSIPKLIFLNSETFEVLADWGPRPQKAVDFLDDLKLKFGGLTPDVKEELQKWYNADKGISTQNELVQILENSVK